MGSNPVNCTTQFFCTKSISIFLIELVFQMRMTGVADVVYVNNVT
jgi:hypothetical protein